MFAERLNQIMELTHTRVSELAKASNLNASHVSRLKNGTRPLPKRPDFLPAMSAYLARRIRADYQRDTLCRKLGLEAWPTDEWESATLLEKWLLGTVTPPTDIDLLVNSFTNVGKRVALNSDAVDEDLPIAKRYYYGPQGKQEAVLQFFDRIKKEKSPQTLLLSSDEDMEWMYESSAFAARWAMDFKQVLHLGNRVRMIHHVGRDLNELLEAVAKWLPIYMTGMIEPYYYPRLRDGIFRRTLFIAPNSAAVISTSIGRNTEGMLNELVANPKAIAALVQEYENYFSLCRPLMKIILENDTQHLSHEPSFFLEGNGDSVCMAGAPSLATMPERVAKSMQKRAPESRILALWEKSHASLTQNLDKYFHTDVLSGATRNALSLPLPCANFLGAPGLCYTSQELAAHWSNLQKLAMEYKHYRYILDNTIPPNLVLYGRENQDTLMIKSDAPNTAFIMSEKNIVNAFWDYLVCLTERF